MDLYPVLSAILVASSNCPRCASTASHVPNPMAGISYPEDNLNDFGSIILIEKSNPDKVIQYTYDSLQIRFFKESRWWRNARSLRFEISFRKFQSQPGRSHLGDIWRNCFFV